MVRVRVPSKYTIARAGVVDPNIVRTVYEMYENEERTVKTPQFSAHRAALPRQKRSQVRPQHKRRGSKLDKRV